MRIRRLYSEPVAFEPVEFFDGVNLILGDTTEENRKTNGVGKSLAMEFLNFGLLKDAKYSRVRLVPSDVLPPETLICVDFEIDEHKVTSQRSVSASSSPILIVDGSRTRYTCLDDATQFLSTLMFGVSGEKAIPSFRAMLGPLMRDERSEFKSIVKCYDTERRVPADYVPHLYLLGIDATPYVDALRLFGEIESARAAIRKASQEVASITGKNVKEAKAELNDLTSQVQRIQADLDALGNSAGYDIVKADLIETERELEVARLRQGVIKTELSRIDLFRGDNYIDADEIAELYNQFRSALGTMIKKEIDEVTAFKRKIDNFQRTLLRERRQVLVSDLKELDRRIAELDRQYSEMLSVIDQQGSLRSLRQTIAAHQKKVENHATLAAFVEKHGEYEREKARKQNDRLGAIYLLQSYVDDAEPTISSVEGTILDIHEYVAGNRHSSFEVDVGKTKEVLNFVLRIHDDGSHSVEREKVFLYDLAMLIGDGTAARHPGLLIHDNIFDVDQDTLVRSLNFLGDNLGLLSDRQYILTINSDKFSVEDRAEMRLDLDAHARARYTKDNRFLHVDYQEVRAS